MRIAFYAPLKSPDHAQPSGDRELARLFVRALRDAGYTVQPVAGLRSWDRGDPHRQQRIAALGARIAARLHRRWLAAPATRPDYWFTYHLYHKAPDWIGPPLCRELGLPYVIAEASFAPRQANGPWALGHAGVDAALGQAAALVNLNPIDLECVRPRLREACHILQLRPFLQPPDTLTGAARRQLREHLGERHALPLHEPWLLCVAMMRDDVKLRSYRVLAEATGQCRQRPWRLVVAGGGHAADQVRQMFADHGERVCFVGQIGPQALQAWRQACDLLVWPALGEAIGMAVLEAQAAGLPVLVGDRPGLRGIVTPGISGELVAEGDVAAFADALSRMLDDPRRLKSMGRRAAALVGEHNSITSASRQLDAMLQSVSGSRP